MYWYNLNAQTIGTGGILADLEVDSRTTFTVKQVESLMREIDIKFQFRIKKIC